MKAFFAAAAVMLVSVSSFALGTQQELAQFLDHQDHVEIEASQMALQKSQTAKITDYATNVRRNHICANRVLVSLAKAENLTLNMSGEFDQALAQLATLSGADFDRGFAKLMVDIHERALMTIDDSKAVEETPVGSFSIIIRQRISDGLDKARAL